ncbi:putative galactan 1,3-beta-galactosidase [Drepanopeziza brunnea f. sp. 'multigermtubi' MB_m1]|uniref:Putative galactan 1,3-beta-galactosidase n=1 Tax=Marssonina brunnea f. sp. multigermtubi (strain MB_m1) TaxID=1072389 RepID=K1Y5M5_MARBU|nr:putative galactan 1,3-beta-galactosidase [Drepanopeziza brunnea f. sp. 'multigermtubi' MB_m1]EKD20509.1 putative galactan 1,3-beta-galactosidase [Drepanopeziza brunnea f. sp. 'multigermtubi' MB_m1]
MLFSRILLTSGLAAGALAASWIVPGADWKDTAGNTIDAHGGMIYQHEANFYWIGQAANDGKSPLSGPRSTDLLNWTPLGAQAAIKWMWRPKIATPNGSFWIYGQVDRSVQALVSSQIEGGYKVNGPAVRIPPNSYSYSDTGMFQDPDTQTWYLMTSADHNIVQINQINPDGTIGDEVNQLIPALMDYEAGGSYEAPGMFKVDNIYFLIVSGKTGWRSNPNQMFWADSIDGNLTGPFEIAPVEENTYNSQNTFELTIKGSKQTTYIYMGDSWDSKGGPSSTYIWLPMKVDATAHTLALEYHAMWKVDVTTGEVSWPTTKKRYEAEAAAISGRAVDTQSQVVFQNITGTGKPQWLALHYTVNNAAVGEAHLAINDQPVPTKISDMNCRAGRQKTIPVELTLKPGDVNKITFGVTGEKGQFASTIFFSPAFGCTIARTVLTSGVPDFEAHLDGIEIFEDA